MPHRMAGARAACAVPCRIDAVGALAQRASPIPALCADPARNGPVKQYRCTRFDTVYTSADRFDHSSPFVSEYKRARPEKRSVIGVAYTGGGHPDASLACGRLGGNDCINHTNATN